MLWYGIGILYDRFGSFDHAEEAFSEVMRMDPKFEKANEIYFRLGIIYKQNQKFSESLEVRPPSKTWLSEHILTRPRSSSSSSSRLLRTRSLKRTSGSKSAMSTSSKKK